MRTARHLRLALRSNARLARAATTAAAPPQHMMGPPAQSPQPVVTAFITSAADGAPSRILLLRRSAAVRCASTAALDALSLSELTPCRTYPAKWHGVSGSIELAGPGGLEPPVERSLVEIEVRNPARAALGPHQLSALSAARAGGDERAALLAAPGVPRPPAARGRRAAVISGAPDAVFHDGGPARCGAELGERRGALGAARRAARL